MRNIFAPRVFRHLTILERVLYSIITFGLPLAILDYFTVEHTEEGWLIGIPVALFGGIIAGVVIAFLEHAFFTRMKR